MKHRSLNFVWGFLLLVLVALGIAAAFVWYKLAHLKTELAADLGRALGARVEVTSLALDWWKGELHAAGITLVNERENAPWERGEISQATIHFHLRDLLSPTLPLRVEVSSWQIVLHSPTKDGTPPAAADPDTASAPAPEPSAPRRVQVTELSAQDGDVQIDLSADRQILVHGVAFDASHSAGQIWTTQLQAASISAGSLQIGSSSVQIRGEPTRIAFSELHMQCAEGAITGDGEIGLDGRHDTRVSLQALNVPVIMLVAVQWQMKLSGLATGDLTYQGNDQDASADGQLAITAGRFNVLPLLGKMAALIGVPDFSGMEVDKATTSFAWKDHVLHLTNIDIRKNDVTRIAGDVDVDANSQVDGRLKLGLPTSILSRWPQLQTSVFPVQLEDYSWTDVHVTGTPNHLQEDLTPRLLAAGLQSGGQLLNTGAQKAIDLLKGFLGP